jgi:hypothetical protein
MDDRLLRLTITHAIWVTNSHYVPPACDGPVNSVENAQKSAESSTWQLEIANYRPYN